MAKTITITSQHDLGIEGAKRNITARYEALKTAYVDRIGRSDLTWTDDIGHGWATMFGQKGSAVIAVFEKDLRIDITLPLLLQPFAGFVENLIRGNADALDPHGDPSKPTTLEPPA